MRVAFALITIVAVAILGLGLTAAVTVVADPHGSATAAGLIIHAFLLAAGGG